MLSLTRGIVRGDAGLKQGVWMKKELMGVLLKGKTLGIVGFGRIGREVAKLARAFGIRLW